MMLPKRKFKVVLLAGVMVILVAFVLAGPVAAAEAMPQTEAPGLVPATGNASAAGMPLWRDGDFVFFVSDGTDLAAAAATAAAASTTTPRLIVRNGAHVAEADVVLVPHSVGEVAGVGTIEWQRPQVVARLRDHGNELDNVVSHGTPRGVHCARQGPLTPA